MPHTRTILTTTFPVGVTIVGPDPVPNNASLAQLTLDMTSFNSMPINAGIVFGMEIDLSEDGGVTWIEETGVTFEPPLTDKNSVVANSFPLSIDLPQPTNNNREARATITVTGQPVTTSGTMVLS